MNIETTPSALLSPQQITKARSIFRQGFSLISKNKIFKEKQHLYSSPSGFTPWKELLGRLMYYDIALPQAMRVGQKCDMEACVASSFALHYDSPVRYISKNLEIWQKKILKYCKKS